MVTELYGTRRGWPPILPDEVVTYMMKYIRAMGGVINTDCYWYNFRIVGVQWGVFDFAN